MNITIQTVPHSQQRYDTAGDWFYIGDDLCIRVSKLSDWRHEMLLAVHELYEAILCEQDGVTQKAVDDFDSAFSLQPSALGEPGDSPNAPYRVQHFRSTNIERQLADHLGVNWPEYEAEINAL
jgi:hypothetical protein